VTGPLPIDTLLADLAPALRGSRTLVVAAPPGSGKSTRIPAALLELPEIDGEIWVTEPRRLAARLVARRVAEERSAELGGEVGYTVRFEDRTCSTTRLRYVTEGILTHRLLADPRLSRIGAVVLDEFHERHLDTDLLLRCVLELKRSRPELVLIVMSATVDAERLSHFLGDCPCLRGATGCFPVDITHADPFDDRPLEKRVAGAVRSLLGLDPPGHVLVFLPGAPEIRRVRAYLDGLTLPHQPRLLVLHGDMSLEEQARCLAPSEAPKVILSTNVAESSVTIDGVTKVVDSGLARVARDAAFTRHRSLSLEKISRASAIQRAGRAGRTAPGQVFRLYSAGDFATRDEYLRPEIERLDLSQLRLFLAAFGVHEHSENHWFAPPPQASFERAGEFLVNLGALTTEGKLTERGRRMLRFPLPPRLARLLVECEDRGIAELGAQAVALLDGRDPLRASFEGIAKGPMASRSVSDGPSDILGALDAMRESAQQRFSSGSLARAGLDRRVVLELEQSARRLKHLATNRAPAPSTEELACLHLEQAMLVAYADRVAHRRAPDTDQLVFANGLLAELAPESVVRRAPYLMAFDLEEKREAGRGTRLRVTRAGRLDPNWLLTVLPDSVSVTTELRWVDSKGRIDALERLCFGRLVLEETARPAPPSPEATQLLVRIARERGWHRTADTHALGIRLELLASHGFTNTSWVLDEDFWLEQLEQQLAHSIELTVLTTPNALSQGFLARHPELAAQLARLTPTSCRISEHRACPIHYVREAPPYIESRLADFFGLVTTPTILAGRLPLTVHLLAPNGRPVQITRDLEGFWERHYPTIRRELARRYPKHPWPEDGRHARPPEPTRGRRPR
jgi:ATP-dependent helicase HrpB